MAHGGNNTSLIYGELVSDLNNTPVTSAEQVWDYENKKNNNPRIQEDINTEVLGRKAISKVKVGVDTIESTLAGDTLELEAGTNITLSADTTNKKVTINSSGGGGGTVGVLNTNNSSAMGVNSSESFSGTIKLHRIAKTGNYTHLLNKPTIISDRTASNNYMGKKFLVSTSSLYDQLTDANTEYVIQDKFDAGKLYSYAAKFNAENYTDISGTQYWYQDILLNEGDYIIVTSSSEYAHLLLSPAVGVWIVSGMPYYTAEADNTTVRVATSAYGTQVGYSIRRKQIPIPANSILSFEGGSIYSSVNNNVLVGNNTAINAGMVKIFDPSVQIKGTWNVAEAYPEWFGAGLGNIVGYGEEGVALTNDTVAIQAATNAFDYVKLSKTYLINTVTVPLYHYVENSTTYTLDGKGFRMMSGSVLKGGVIYVNSSYKYTIANQQLLITQYSAPTTTRTVYFTGTTYFTSSKTMTVGSTEYYYDEFTLKYGSDNVISNSPSAVLFIKSGSSWVLNSGTTYTASAPNTVIRWGRLKSSGATNYNYSVTSGAAYYDNYDFLITSYTNNNSTNIVSSAITIGAESTDTSSRRVTIEDVVIRAGSIVDANDDEIAGGTKTTNICAGIKTDMEKIGTRWSTYNMFTDVVIYGLFYGIAGNLRGSKFDVILEQCYDNIDIYGGKNIFNLNGQTGVLLDLNPNGEAIYEFEYFVYLQGAGNVINDGIYDIGSKVRNHKYLIKEDSRNVINSSLKTDYKNALTNLTNGDYRSDLDYTWLGTHKHDYKQDGLQYTATLTEGYHTIKVDGQNVNTNDVSGIDFLNRSSILYLHPNEGQTMSLTLLFEKVKNPFGVSVFAQSNGYNFRNMEIYYSTTTYLTGSTVLVNGDSRVITSSTEIANGSTITVNPGTASEATYTIDGYNVVFNAGNLYVYTLVANVKQGGYPSLDWNAEYNQYRDYNQENMRVVLTSDEEVRFYGMCVYTKTSQSLTYGSTANRPVKGLYVGQSYFDTDLSPTRPVFWNGTSWSDLISTVELPTHQYIDYFEPDAGVDYHSVSNGTGGVSITVKCYPDGKFESTGSVTAGGGRLTKLSEVFTIPAGGVYTLTREIIRGTEIPSGSGGATTVDGMMPYIVEDVQGNPNVTNFDRATKILDTTGWAEDKDCFIGFNYTGPEPPNNAVSYDNSIKLKVSTMATFNLDSVIGDILFRLSQLEGE